MGIKPDKWIQEKSNKESMIVPFQNSLTRKGVISWGLSSYGYDVRIADEYKIFTNINTTIVDPKNFDERSFIDFKGEICIIPPNSFALGRTVEYFHIPRDVIGICLGKSTYARAGIVLNTTPLEPGWSGHLVLEISNTTPLPCRIYSNEGIGQIIFLEGDEGPLVSYADRDGGGKYQDQKGIVLPRV